MTQKISPDVLASAALMASPIRSLSACEIIDPSPASRRPAAAERSATAGKPTAGKPAVGGAGGPTRPRRRAARPSPARPPPTAVPRDGADERKEYESEHCENQQHDQDRNPARRRFGSLGGTLLPFSGVARQHADDVVDATRDAAGEITGAKARGDRILDDKPRNGIGERTLEPVAH